MKKNQSAPISPVKKAEMTNAASFTRIARTPRPLARSSSSRMARSCRPNLDRRISQESAIVATAMTSAM